MSEVKDFDAFWAEHQQQDTPFKVFGKTEYLPSSLPATMVLQLIELEKKHGNDLPDSALIEFAASVFGKGKIEEWSSQGLSIDQLTDLIDWAMEKYNPNSTAPETGQE